MACHVFFNQVLVRYPVADGEVTHLVYVVLALRGQQVAIRNSEIHYGE